jgi:hypothetical protein
LKTFLNFLPHFFLNNNSHNTTNFFLDNNTNINFGEHETLLDEIEKEYLQEHFDQLHNQEVFNEENLNEKFEYLQGITKMNGNEKFDEPDHEMKNNKYFKKGKSPRIGEKYDDEEHYFVEGKKIKKVKFIKKHHREGFKSFFDKFISEKFNLSNYDTHQKFNITEKKHLDHFDQTKKKSSKKIRHSKKKNKKIKKNAKIINQTEIGQNTYFSNKSNMEKIVHEDETFQKLSNNNLFHELDKLMNLTENLEEILNQTHPEILEHSDTRNLINIVIETLKVVPNYTKVHEERKYQTLKKFSNGSSTINFLQMEEKLKVFIKFNSKSVRKI